MAALLSTSRRRKKNRSCYFCGAKPADCQCGGWSRTDENGNLIDYVPEMSDPALNPTLPLASTPRLASQSARPSASASPFCRTCLTNQSLQLNLLANYLPTHPDSHSLSAKRGPACRTETQKLVDDLPRYKASLEARYPVLCPACSPNVSAIIKERNYKVKAESLHESIKRLVHAPRSPTRFPANPFQTPLPIHGMGGALWTAQEWAWRVQRALWVWSNVIGIYGALYCALPPHHQPTFPHPLHTPINILWTLSRALSSLISNLDPLILHCTLELLWCFHDLAWSKVRRNRAQGIRTKIIGKRTYLCLNAIAYLVRLLVYQSCESESSTSQSLPTALQPTDPIPWSVLFSALAVLLTILFASALAVLTTRAPIALKPARASRSLASAAPVLSPSWPAHAVFETLSLKRPVPDVAPHCGPSRDASANERLSMSRAKRRPSPPESTAEVPMDWEPTPIMPHLMSDTTVLRPQTFWPPPSFRPETGIEEVFERKVRLEDSGCGGAEENIEEKKVFGWFRNVFGGHR